MVVDGRRNRLYEKDLFTAHRLQQLYRHLAVRKPIDGAGTKLDAELVSNCGRQRRVGCAAEDRESIFHAARRTRMSFPLPAAALGARICKMPFSKVACTLSMSISTGKLNIRDIGRTENSRWMYLRPDLGSVCAGSVETVRLYVSASTTISPGFSPGTGISITYASAHGVS